MSGWRSSLSLGRDPGREIGPSTWGISLNCYPCENTPFRRLGYTHFGGGSHSPSPPNKKTGGALWILYTLA